MRYLSQLESRLLRGKCSTKKNKGFYHTRISSRQEQLCRYAIQSVYAVSARLLFTYVIEVRFRLGCRKLYTTSASTASLSLRMTACVKKLLHCFYCVGGNSRMRLSSYNHMDTSSWIHHHGYIITVQVLVQRPMKGYSYRLLYGSPSTPPLRVWLHAQDDSSTAYISLGPLIVFYQT